MLLISRFHIINGLVGTGPSRGEFCQIRILCFTELHVHFSLIRDLQVGKILLQVDFRIEIHLVIPCCDNLFRIQLVFHLFKLRQGFHIGLQFFFRIHLRGKCCHRSYSCRQYHDCREQSRDHSCCPVFLSHSRFVPFLHAGTA